MCTCSEDLKVCTAVGGRMLPVHVIRCGRRAARVGWSHLDVTQPRSCMVYFVGGHGECGLL